MEENKSVCCNCLREFSILIVCTECFNIRLCFTCFSSGVESGFHKRSHSYKIEHIIAQQQCVFDEWTSDEELRLLIALEQYGIGNWEDICLKVETKSSQECMKHYCTYYLGGIFGLELINISNKHYSRITDHTIGTLTSFLSEYNSSRSLSLDVEDQQQLGYMPDRGDFERDYDNDAESILCRLHPSFSHDELEDALKVAQVTIYIQRLRERQRRKDIACEHGLISHILAFILNKRLKKRTPINMNLMHNDLYVYKQKGKPFSFKKALRSKMAHKTSPIKRTINHKQTLNVPPPGSWLAAPFILQASGANKGTPLVNGLSATSSSHSSSVLKSSNLNKPIINFYSRENSLLTDNFNAFCLNEKLKPFLRYFTGVQGKSFTDNLYKEELLKHEIRHLLDLRTRGRVKLNAQKLKFPPFKSTVYQLPQRTGNFVHDYLFSHLNLPNRTKKRRRSSTCTPWYIKVQRKSRQHY